MPGRRKTRGRFMFGFAFVALGAVSVAVVGAGRATSRGASQAGGSAPAPARPPKAAAEESSRQVTVFAILATPDPKTIDPRLDVIREQLSKVLPDHGFKLLDVKSKRIGAGQSVTCDLGDGYTARTELVCSFDENGKVQLRCGLSYKGAREFSTLVKTPVNQLFFYERTLRGGSRVLIGVGAREHISQAQEYDRLP